MERIFVTPKSRDFHEISTFLENDQDASRKLLGYLESGLECFRRYREWFWDAQRGKEKSDFFFDIFSCLTTFSVVQLFCGCRSRVRVPMQYAFTRAGYVYRGGGGSTGPSCGEHRLTVYLAHASWDQMGLSKKLAVESEKRRYLRICEFVWLRSNFPS